MSQLKFDGAGNALISARIGAGYTERKAFALRIKMPESTLLRYETNERAISTSALEKIARGIGEPVEVLILKCLEAKYPKLSKTKSGTLLRGLVEAIRSESAPR
jgi:transcriptional regulator with XRE-family HTH domain